jgi:hypothetical protein
MVIGLQKKVYINASVCFSSGRMTENGDWKYYILSLEFLTNSIEQIPS